MSGPEQAAQDTWRTVEIGDAALETLELAPAAQHAERAEPAPPVILIGTALTADELLPAGRLLAAEVARPVIAYRRRGYGASTPVDGPGAVIRDAEDALALLDALGIPTATLVGVSYSGAVAVRAAADFPNRVGGVIAIEPPPQADEVQDFHDANAELVAEATALGVVPTADRFLARMIEPHWRLDLERILPGVVAQVERDAATFFDADIPALQGWRLGDADAERVTAPVLLVGGSDSGRWFTAAIETLRGILPGASRVTVAHADHSLALTHPHDLALLMSAFLREE